MIRLDLKSNQPIYEQIISQYKHLVIKDYLKKGDMIPSVRKLALELSVTPGTVAKAYQEMERQGMIETLRGKGTYIADVKKNELSKGAVAEVKEELKKQIMELVYMGITKKEVVKLIEEVYESLEEKGDER